MVTSFLLHAARETDGKNHQIGLAFDCSLASRAVTPSSDSMGCHFLWEGSWCQLKCLAAIWQKVLKWCKILLPVQVCSKEVWKSSFVPKGFLFFFLFFPDQVKSVLVQMAWTLLGNSTEKQLWVQSRPALGLLEGGYPHPQPEQIHVLPYSPCLYVPWTQKSQEIKSYFRLFQQLPPSPSAGYWISFCPSSNQKNGNNIYFSM